MPGRDRDTGNLSRLPWLLRRFAGVSRLIPGPLKTAIYDFPRLAAALRSLMNIAAPPEPMVIDVTGGILVNHKMRLDLKFEKFYWLGTYEPQLQRFLKEAIRPGMVVYDVGANIGYVSLMLAHLLGDTGRVYSFEPHPGNLRRLEENVSLNGWNDRIVVTPLAVSDKAGSEEFLVHTVHGMGKLSGSAGRTETYPETLSVPCVSLDSFVFEQGHPIPDMVKIDVEGGEIKVLPGMRRLLKQARPSLIIEVHGFTAASSILSILNEYSYNIHRLNSKREEIRTVEEMSWKEYVIALPSGEAVE